MSLGIQPSSISVNKEIQIMGGKLVYDVCDDMCTTDYCSSVYWLLKKGLNVVIALQSVLEVTLGSNTCCSCFSMNVTPPHRHGIPLLCRPLFFVSGSFLENCYSYWLLMDPKKKNPWSFPTKREQQGRTVWKLQIKSCRKRCRTDLQAPENFAAWQDSLDRPLSN